MASSSDPDDRTVDLSHGSPTLSVKDGAVHEGTAKVTITKGYDVNVGGGDQMPVGSGDAIPLSLAPPDGSQESLNDYIDWWHVGLFVLILIPTLAVAHFIRCCGEAILIRAKFPQGMYYDDDDYDPDPPRMGIPDDQEDNVVVLEKRA